MDIGLKDENYSTKLINLKDNLYKSKKYWIIYLILIFLASISIFRINDYLHPEVGIFVIILLAIVGTLCISYYNSHNSNKELYKTVFIVILTFGIVCSFLTPICYVPDEVEHFVRSEMTSRGEFIPIYENGSYTTIQSTLDLIKDSTNTTETGFDQINGMEASIFKTDSDTRHINLNPVNYPSAFAENPFFGYLPQAIGMLIAKLFDLNSIWLLWLGRIFNTLLYASLVSIAIKKTPILKVPLFIASIIPLSIFQIASVSIDSMVNGLAILMIAYFFYLYKAPDYTLNEKHILVFSILGLLLGLCKVTYFTFILLILVVPKTKFVDKKYYYRSIFSILLLGIIAVLWTKFYADPVLMNSFRGNYYEIKNINSSAQLSFILSHPRDFAITMLNIPQQYFDVDLLFASRSSWFNKYNSLYLMFLGAVCLLYPKEKINIVSRVCTLLVPFLLYFGTYFSFLLTWTSVGHLNPIGGVQPRYFLPLFGLFPFIFGFNNTEFNNNFEIDIYLIVIALSFLAVMLISMGILMY